MNFQTITGVPTTWRGTVPPLRSSPWGEVGPPLRGQFSLVGKRAVSEARGSGLFLWQVTNENIREGCSVGMKGGCFNTVVIF